MMRLIQKHSDYAHIRIRICIRMYPNIFADADIKLHMYPIPKSAWEKKRMANSNELLCANRCPLRRNGGRECSPKQLVLTIFIKSSLFEMQHCDEKKISPVY